MGQPPVFSTNPQLEVKTLEMSEWDQQEQDEDEDDASFQAALAFLDDCIQEEDQLDPAPALSATSRPSSVGNNGPVAKQKRSKVRHRNRRKDEILALRAQVERLEPQLRRLQATLRQSQRATKDAAVSDVMLALWKETAGRQAQLRELSEKENLRLRYTVTKHHRLVQTLQRLLRQLTLDEARRLRCWLGQSGGLICDVCYGTVGMAHAVLAPARPVALALCGQQCCA